MPARPADEQPPGAATRELLTVLLVDDQAMWRQLAATFRALEPDLVVVGEAASAAEAMHLAQELRPDIVVLDLHLGCEDGLTLLGPLQQALPAAVLIAQSGVSPDSSQAREALRRGAHAFLPKDDGVEGLAQALRDAHQHVHAG